MSKKKTDFCQVATVDICLGPGDTLLVSWDGIVLENDPDEGMPTEIFGLLARYGLNLPLPNGSNSEVRISDKDAEIIRSNHGKFTV